MCDRADESAMFYHAIALSNKQAFVWAIAFLKPGKM